MAMTPFTLSKRQLPLLATAAVIVLGGAAAALYLSRKKKKAEKRLKYEIVFVLGGPGAGKGTQCALLVERHGLVHLSAGDLLREERNRGTELATMINTYIQEGKIVPAEVTVGLLRAAMEKAEGKTKFLIDGFPRDPGNLRCWIENMSDHAHTKAVLYLNAPEEVMLQRLLERGKTSGRTDDNADSIKKRFKTYLESTMPIIQHFQAQGKVWEVQADRPLGEVSADVFARFDTW
ncbi:ump-cmp kinase-like [Nannochloropsis oceanica]